MTIEKSSFTKNENMLGWQEFRCPICHKLFFWGKLDCALIEVKCRCCKNVIKIES